MINSDSFKLTKITNDKELKSVINGYQSKFLFSEMINKELSNKQNANNKFTDKDLLILWLGNNDIQSNLNLAAIFTK